MEWYIGRRRDQSTKKRNLTPLACLRETLNYSYGGTKANANLLIDVATTNSDGFFRKGCPAKDRTDAEQYRQIKAESAQGTTKSPWPWG